MRIFSHFSMTYRKYFSLCIYLSVPISSPCSPTTLRFFIESVGNTCDFQEEITTCSGKIISSRYMFPFWKLFFSLWETLYRSSVGCYQQHSPRNYFYHTGRISSDSSDKLKFTHCLAYDMYHYPSSSLWLNINKQFHSLNN